MRLAALVLLAFGVAARDDGLALTPPMGWRSWNYFHGNINQDILKAQVDAIALKVNVTTLWVRSGGAASQALNRSKNSHGIVQQVIT